MDHDTVPVHGGLTTVASREACQDAAHWRCRAWELTATGKKLEGTPVNLIGCINGQ
jgi:hypothetical protein